MIIDPKDHDDYNIYKLMIGSIVPRPIAFVSSISVDGIRNLAPFSFFNGVCSNPPTILFCTVVRKDGKHKDTLNNVAATKEFVVNIVSEDFAEQMNITSGDFPPNVDEFEVSGLTPIPSDLVKPSRVKESRISLECKLQQIVTVNDLPGGGVVVFGEILRFHIADELFDNYRIDQDKLRAIGRMGGPTYTRTRDRFDLIRLKAGEIKSP
ncbi:MAG: flavin reductase family protein [Ignavibacteriae bacterium]|nr:flavin reductase family protein [Ignavibacteria bacterium]MBI3363587.1 flavin reductase family protein [Ignavibacteriota bacterium]